MNSKFLILGLIVAVLSLLGLLLSFFGQSIAIEGFTMMSSFAAAMAVLLVVGFVLLGYGFDAKNGITRALGAILVMVALMLTLGMEALIFLLALGLGLVGYACSRRK